MFVRFIHEKLSVGDKLDVVGPDGDFYFVEGMAKNITLIGGGIGITPLMGIMNYIHESGIDVRVNLLYSAKFVQDFVFLKEIEKVLEKKNFTGHFVVTDEPPPKKSNLSFGDKRIDFHLIKGKRLTVCKY